MRLSHVTVDLAHPTLFARCFIVVLALSFQSGFAGAQESTEESIAAYADAASFQTNGAFDLAIESWSTFLDDYGDDPLASKAAHYLGVCQMQKDPPDYRAASKAFARALKDKNYDLREETLANQGWCLYASAGEGQQRDKKLLKETIQTFQTLEKENRSSRFLDRAYFYIAEAYYGLSDRTNAVKYYDKLLSLPGAKDSPLRCDALYARGIAYEEANKIDQAVASFQQLLGSCENEELITDVHLRLGDMMIMRKDFPRAIRSFDAAIKTAATDDDRAYAIFRQAYAMVQSDRPSDAAAKYEKLIRDFPKSPYAATATLASAQSTYRSGDMDAAAERFTKVLQQNNPVAATEAAHWLARIYLGKNQPDQAAAVAKKQIDAGAKGEFATDLQVDFAEALALNPKTVERSIRVSEQVYREAPDDPLAPRALYNAAFSALQINQSAKAMSLAEEFTRKFPKDTLLPDIQFIAAEGQLLTGKFDKAATTYRKLLSSTSNSENQQRPMWVIRAAIALNAAKQYDQTVNLVQKESGGLPQSMQKAEAFMLAGQANMQSKKYPDAALSFQRSLDADSKWPRADECRLMAGQALFLSGNQKNAAATWETMIAKSSNPRMADQARYKLAQMSTRNQDFKTAIKRYDEILSSQKDLGLIPYAQYGKGWSLMQIEDYKNALLPLTQVVKQNQKHPIRDDALLARGITLRNLKRYDDAEKDLAEFLDMRPQGTNLGHALYELALIDQENDAHEQAAKRLEQLVNKVPDYPLMDKVIYELGWSLHEAGNDEAASMRFAQLIKRYPKATVAADAAYFIGQQKYEAGDWAAAAKQFKVTASRTEDKALSEKAHYRLGWSYFKSNQFDQAAAAFQAQAKQHSNGALALDAMMMVGECQFKQRKYSDALAAYKTARVRIQQKNDTAKTIREPAEQQVRELVLLHGGQSAAQMKSWDEAIGWYDELKARFPSTAYLPQVFYESAFVYQQKNNLDKALELYSQVAKNYRNEVAARARFMIGEIYFGQRAFDKAIPEFQRVMYGFGGEKAPEKIKNWQAKSGYEAARCSELMMQQAKTAEARSKARKFAITFYRFVADKHSGHELADKSRQRLEALNRS